MMGSTSQRLDRIDLRGSVVLVVEDDYFLADEICGALRDCGASVVGPAPDIERGRRLLVNSGVLDCAVLDLNLHGELAFEFAAEVRRRHVPLIFATGYDQEAIPPELSDIMRLEKPVNLNDLLRAVRARVGRNADEQAKP